MAAVDRLPCQWQKCVLGRCLGNLAIRLSDAYLEAPDALTTQLLDELAHATGRELTNPTGVSPTEFLENLPQQIVDPSRVPAGQEAAAKSFRIDLEARIGAFLETGEDPIEALWTDTLEAGATLYRSCGFDPQPDRLRLSPGFRQEPLHNLPGPVEIAGRVEFGNTRRKIELLVTPNFGWQDILCIPYVLFHEVVAHALAGEDQAAGVGADSKFAEGWMDFVAHQAHCAAVGDRAPLGGCEAFFELAGDFEDAGTALHLARHRESSRPGWASRAIGRRAAQRASGLLDHMGLQADRGASPFWQLSVALNRSGASQARLDRLCVKLYRDTDREAKAGLLFQGATAVMAAKGEAARAGAAEAMVEDFLAQEPDPYGR